MTNTEPQEFYEHHRITVDPGQSPLRLDKFLVDRLERVTRNRIQNGIQAGAIRVNDKEVKSNYKVRPNDVVVIVLDKPPRFDDEPEAEEMDLDIHYEDDTLLVLQKPYGLVVHPGIGNYTGTLVNGLMHHLKNLPNLNAELGIRPGLVHRLDKDTSGLMVIAKTEFAMSHLARQFFDRTVERTYQALVWGEPDELEGRIEGPIGRHPTQRIKQHVFEEGEGGKFAATNYKVLEPMYYVSLVECKLETGRTHQIRVHMAHIGHPVFSDAVYGGNTIRKGTVFSKYKQFVHNCFKQLPRQALHAKTLGFIHPDTGEKMNFDSPLPKDMAAVLDRWRSYLDTRKEGV